MATVVLVGALAAGCASSGAEGSPGKLRVVTTVAPITSIVAAVAGRRADVAGIVPEGTNSHTFEPRPSAAEALSRADVVFVNGLGLDGPTERLARANLKKGARLVELGDRSIAKGDELYDFSFPRKDGRPNPHLWTDPEYALAYGRVAEDALAAADPAGAAEYAANGRAFAAAAGALDAAMRQSLGTVAPARRKLLTYHDAYAYFGRDYGWDIVGAIQVSDFEDPTPKEVAALIDQVRATGVPAIFGSEVFPSPVLAQIGRETGARYVDVLRDDDLPGRPGQPEHSWLALLRFDYRTITAALGGDPAALDGLALPALPDQARYPQ
ncbi:MAG TPA: metal ABC transporter substrate-binding protein [Acidimicrobiales bacterium]|nr:metal ABC transporter substrate-binding protein [Acidimicrobiales bacterium]